MSDDSDVTSIKSALSVIMSFVEYYGEETVVHLMVPFIKQQVCIHVCHMCIHLSLHDDTICTRPYIAGKV